MTSAPDTKTLLDPEELAGSVTGFDEIAIAKAFDMDLVDMQQKGRSTLMMRALLFVVRRREGMKDGEARKAVLEMTLGEVMEAFDTDEPDEVDPDDPVTEAGKDGA